MIFILNSNLTNRLAERSSRLQTRSLGEPTSLYALSESKNSSPESSQPARLELREDPFLTNQDELYAPEKQTLPAPEGTGQPGRQVVSPEVLTGTDSDLVSSTHPEVYQPYDETEIPTHTRLTDDRVNIYRGPADSLDMFEPLFPGPVSPRDLAQTW